MPFCLQFLLQSARRNVLKIPHRLGLPLQAVVCHPPLPFRPLPVPWMTPALLCREMHLVEQSQLFFTLLLMFHFTTAVRWPPIKWLNIQLFLIWSRLFSAPKCHRESALLEYSLWGCMAPFVDVHDQSLRTAATLSFNKITTLDEHRDWLCD